MWAYGSYSQPVGRPDHTQSGKPAAGAPGSRSSPTAHSAISGSHIATPAPQHSSLQGRSIKQLSSSRLMQRVPRIDETVPIGHLKNIWADAIMSNEPQSIFIMKRIVQTVSQDPEGLGSNPDQTISDLRDSIAQKEILLIIEGLHPDGVRDPNQLIGSIKDPTLRENLSQIIREVSVGRQQGHGTIQEPQSVRVHTVDGVAQRVLAPNSLAEGSSASSLRGVTPLFTPEGIRQEIEACNRLIAEGLLDQAVLRVQRLDKHDQNILLCKIANLFTVYGYPDRAIEIGRAMPADLRIPEEVYQKNQVQVLALIAKKQFSIVLNLVSSISDKLSPQYRNELCKEIVMAACVGGDLPTANGALKGIDGPDKERFRSIVAMLATPSTSADRLAKVRNLVKIATDSRLLNDVLEETVARDKCARWIKDGDVRSLKRYIEHKPASFLLQICYLLIKAGFMKTARSVMSKIPADTGVSVLNVDRDNIQVKLLLDQNKFAEAAKFIRDSSLNLTDKDRLLKAILYMELARNDNSNAQKTLDLISDGSLQEDLRRGYPQLKLAPSTASSTLAQQQGAASGAAGQRPVTSTRAKAREGVVSLPLPSASRYPIEPQGRLTAADRENGVRDAAKIPGKLAKELEKAQAQAGSQRDGQFSYQVTQGDPVLSVTRDSGSTHEKILSQSETVNGHEVGICHFQGDRAEMEDQHLATAFILNIQGREYPVELYGVFDGHGGKRAANYVKDNLQKKLEETLKEFCSEGLTDEGIWNALKQTFVKLNKEFGSNPSGTTATVAMTLNGKLWTANVGDSRTILDDARQLSEDAKPTDPRYKKGIINREGVIVNDRINGLLAVGRALGDYNIGSGVSARPKITAVPLSSIPINGHLILACDGVWDVASTRQVAEGVKDHRELSAAQLARDIVHGAYRAGSTDNLSALVINLNPARAAAPIGRQGQTSAAQKQVAPSSATIRAQSGAGNTQLIPAPSSRSMPPLTDIDFARLYNDQELGEIWNAASQRNDPKAIEVMGHVLELLQMHSKSELNGKPIQFYMDNIQAKQIRVDLSIHQNPGGVVEARRKLNVIKDVVIRGNVMRYIDSVQSQLPKPR